VRDGYATPQAMENAISAKARSAGRETGVNPGDLVTRFYFQRLLARVFQEDGWMLKGGQSLLVRYPGHARASRDADLFRPATDDIREAVTALERAAARDLGDYFGFSATSVQVEGNGAKVKLDVLIGRRSKTNIDVDVVVNRMPTGEPTPMRLSPAVPVDWPDTWPEVLLYPLPDHVADKICAMYELHERQDGRLVPSTRFRDLGDLILISQRESLDGRAVQFALHSEVPRRNAIPRIVLSLPEAFKIPDLKSWGRGYPKEADQITGLRGCRSMAEAARAADLFITPLLSGGDPGVWSPQAAGWLTR
jgi:hypothetical protein